MLLARRVLRLGRSRLARPLSGGEAPPSAASAFRRRGGGAFEDFLRQSGPGAGEGGDATAGAPLPFERATPTAAVTRADLGDAPLDDGAVVRGANAVHSGRVKLSDLLEKLGGDFADAGQDVGAWAELVGRRGGGLNVEARVLHAARWALTPQAETSSDSDAAAAAGALDDAEDDGEWEWAYEYDSSGSEAGGDGDSESDFDSSDSE